MCACAFYTVNQWQAEQYANIFINNLAAFHSIFQTKPFAMSQLNFSAASIITHLNLFRNFPFPISYFILHFFGNPAWSTFFTWNSFQEINLNIDSKPLRRPNAGNSKHLLRKTDENTQNYLITVLKFMCTYGILHRNFFPFLQCMYFTSS